MHSQRSRSVGTLRDGEVQTKLDPVFSSDSDLESSIVELDERCVYVVDDDADVRESISFLMASREIKVQAFESGRSFLESLSGLSAGPILLDIRMPDMDGIEVLQELARHSIKWPVLVLSGHGDVGVAVSALKLGASDFLEKPISPIELEKCLKSAFRKLESEKALYVSRSASRQLLSSLTPRESEVIAGLCSGKANKQVAFAMSISPRTVEMHRANALRRLGLRSIAEVVTLMNETRRE